MYGCFTIVGIVGFCICKKKKYQEWQKSFLLCIGIAVLAWGIEISEIKNGVIVENGFLIRRPVGEGEYETELILKVGEQKERKFQVNVPEQLLTSEEEMNYLRAAVEELETVLKEENSAFPQIREVLKKREQYQNNMVTAVWEFSNPDLINMDGRINEDAIVIEGEALNVRVTLTCGSSKVLHTMVVNVYHKEKSKEEILDEKINEIILENSKESGTKVLSLPQEVENQTLQWKAQDSQLPGQIFLLGIMIALLLPALESEKQHEKKKKREEQLLREYPEMVNKLTLLLGAGMTVQIAWNKITDMYLMARKEGKVSRNEVYEEMLITRHEIESGRGEIRSYEAFGERCALPRFRKFSNYLVQNIKKGSLGVCDLLEKEAMEVFIERKNRARRYGEEATTKLLFPMLLMLGIVIFIIMVPAIISFQMGT